MVVVVQSLQSCLTLCDPMGSSVQGILQARVLECVDMSAWTCGIKY